MKFLAVAALLAGAAIAAPTSNTGGSACPAGLYSNPQCCATVVLGVIGLDCQPPDGTPHDGGEFKRICANTGRQAVCCVVPVAGQDLLCSQPPGSA